MKNVIGNIIASSPVRRIVVSGGVTLAGITTIIALGDSLTNPGDKASPSSNSWINLLIAQTGKTLSNQAATGRGIAYAVSRMFAVADVTQSNEAVIVFAGFNDIRYTGATSKRILQIKHALRSIIASQFASSSSICAGDVTTISNEGLYNRNHSSSGYNGKANSFATASRRALLTSYGNPDVAQHFTWDFTGDNLIVGYVGYDDADPAYEHGSFQALVDGQLKATVEPAGQTQGLPNPGFEMEQRVQPACLLLTGLGAGSHTMRINPLEQGVNKIWDWFGTLRPAADCAPVIIMSPSYQPDYVTGQDPFDNGSDAAMDAVRDAAIEVKNEFKAIDEDYPVEVVDVNVDLSKATMFDADLVHRNNLGHAHLKTRVMTVIRGY